MQDTAKVVSAALGLALLLGSGAVWATVLGRLAKRKAPIAFEPRGSVPWQGLDVVVLLMFYLLCEIAARSLLRQWADYEPGQVSSTLLFGQAAAHVVWLVFSVAYLVARSAARGDQLGFDTGPLAGDVRLGVMLFLAAAVPVFAVQIFFVYGVGLPSEHPAIKLTQAQTTLPALAAMGVVVVGIAPLFEEFLFRVLLQGWLEGAQARLRALREEDGLAVPGYAPLVVVSALFAGMHFGHGPDPAAIFVLSLFLGYAYRQTHRIVPSLVAHACLNGWTMLNLSIQMWSQST